jgi:hypothetical protein
MLFGEPYAWDIKFHLFFQFRQFFRDSRSQWPYGLRHELSSPSQTGVVGYNPTRDMDVSVYSMVMLF